MHVISLVSLFGWKMFHSILLLLIKFDLPFFFFFNNTHCFPSKKKKKKFCKSSNSCSSQFSCHYCELQSKTKTQPFCYLPPVWFTLFSVCNLCRLKYYLSSLVRYFLKKLLHCYNCYRGSWRSIFEALENPDIQLRLLHSYDYYAIQILVMKTSDKAYYAWFVSVLYN